MNDAYDSALRKIAEAYEAEVSLHGGKSLARVATIVVSSGAFFRRLREGKPFLTRNLDKLALYFRNPANWPSMTIPHEAVLALRGIGREPYPSQRIYDPIDVRCPPDKRDDPSSVCLIGLHVRCDPPAPAHPHDAA